MTQPLSCRLLPRWPETLNGVAKAAFIFPHKDCFFTYFFNKQDLKCNTEGIYSTEKQASIKTQERPELPLHKIQILPQARIFHTQNFISEVPTHLYELRAIRMIAMVRKWLSRPAFAQWCVKHVKPRVGIGGPLVWSNTAPVGWNYMKKMSVSQRQPKTFQDSCNIDGYRDLDSFWTHKALCFCNKNAQHTKGCKT